MSVSPRFVALVGLAALLPAIVFVLAQDFIAVVTLLNVVLITVSLWIALSPHEHEATDGAV
jgi:hypothetical protein